MPVIRNGLLLALLLEGCATRITSAQRIGLDQFVGKPRAYLLAELGAPKSTQAAQTRQGIGVANLTFVSQSDELVRPDLNFVFSGTNEPGTAWVDRLGTHLAHRLIVTFYAAPGQCQPAYRNSRGFIQDIGDRFEPALRFRARPGATNQFGCGDRI